jgi:serine/threonine protein phosphatase 1
MKQWQHKNRQRMEPSSPRKIFAVGDIHGCRQKLENLLGQLPYDRERDLLIFLGDYINRGPQSREVIDLLCDLQRSGGHLVTLMGNHEYLLLEYQQSSDPALIPLLRQMQIESTLASYGLKDLSRLQRLAGLPEEHRQFLAGLRPFYETEHHIFVHAGLYPGLMLAQQEPSALMEIRDAFLTSTYDFGKVVVFGHSTFQTPLLSRTKIGIDTGAVYGNMLTALELPAMVFHHA